LTGSCTPLMIKSRLAREDFATERPNLENGV
jgi:hypothetical protein